MKVIAKHQDWRWIKISYECWQLFLRNAEVNDRDHNDKKEFSNDCHDHWRRKKLVVHIINMMQSKQYQHHYDVINCIETEYEVMMQEYKHYVCQVKQQMITQCNQDCINDIEICNEWWILNIY